MTARELVAALGGTWTGEAGTAACPAHNDSTPSLSITERDGRVLFRCHAGCPQGAVIAVLRNRRLWPAETGAKSQQANGPEHPNEHQERALRIWKETTGAARTPVETYLKSRGIELPAVPDALRFHGRLRHKQSKQTLPAMVAGVADKHGAVVAIHRTYLRADGVGKADVGKAKMMLGPVAGAAVRLAEAGDTLIVAEGIETALSIGAATGLPAWAALSTSGLRALELPPLPLAAEVIIAADADEPGLKAAGDAAARWVREGRRVRIAVPPEGDFNDVLREVGAARVRELINSADDCAMAGDDVSPTEGPDDNRRVVHLEPARWND
ncbi:MAG: toprim domain-containing protein, partial [Phycisphaerales bacterium]